MLVFFFFQAEDGIRDLTVTGVQTCALPILPHLGLDVVAPGERYSAGRFARDAARWLEEIRAAARQPVVVGGTGLYVRALADGLFREPPLDAVRRERLREWTTRPPPVHLAPWAARVDRRVSRRGGGAG